MMWEFQQQSQIRSAEASARKAESKADRFESEIRQMSRHLDRLSVACQAMWELLRDHSTLSEDDLEAKMSEVDGRDGEVDGRISRQVMPCPHCDRMTNTRRDCCLLCGGLLDRPHAFEG